MASHRFFRPKLDISKFRSTDFLPAKIGDPQIKIVSLILLWFEFEVTPHLLTQRWNLPAALNESKIAMSTVVVM